MKQDDQIAAALAWIAELDPTTGPWDAQMKALAADYERRGEEIERLRDRVEYLLQRNGVLEEVNNKLRWEKDHAESETQRLRIQVSAIKGHLDEYLTNEDLTAEKAMRLIGRKLS